MKYCIVFTVLMLSAQTAVSEPAKVSTCSACHGESGAVPIAPSYPKLAGQNEAYILSALKSYKAGKRQGGLSAVMSSQAAMLSEDEMIELAKYYSMQIPK